MSGLQSLPSVSVVVPNFNHSKFLPTCLNAILAQSVKPLEVIVLDDCSTDNSIEVIGQFAEAHPVVKLVRNEKNLGVMPNLNKGVLMSRGDYICIGSADDEILPGLLEKSLTMLAKHPSAGISSAIGDWHEVATGLNWQMGVGMGSEPCFLAPDRLVEMEQQERIFIVSNTCIFHRERLKALGLFIPELRWHADWFAIYALALRHGLCFVPEPLGRFNIMPGSYYKSGRQKPELHNQVMRGIVARLASPEYADIGDAMRRGGGLFSFGWPMLTTLRSDPRFRKFLTANLLRRALWQEAKVRGKDHLPRPLANLYLRLAGYRTKPGK